MPAKSTFESASVQTPLEALIPAPHALRRELVTLVYEDLLGPKEGAEEEVNEQYVSERYLVGMLAGQKQQEKLELDNVTAENPTEAEEGGEEESSLAGNTLFPSSFGFSCVVPLNVKELEVGVRWGHYTRQKSETLLSDAGNPKMVWKRTPREETSHPVSLEEGTLQWQPTWGRAKETQQRWHPSEEQPEVWVQGRARKVRNQWVVSFFLVNGQPEPDKGARDSSWLFQAEMWTRAPDGKAVFSPTLIKNESSDLDGEWKSENDALNMAYRHCSKFASGHGVSVHATHDPTNSNCAVEIRTCSIPEFEVDPTIAPTAQENPSLDAVELDMKTLAECDAKVLFASLEQLCEAYENWIHGEEKKLQDNERDLQQHEELAQRAIANCRRALGRMREGVKTLRTNGAALEAWRFANRSMYLQRVHSIAAENKRRGIEKTLAEVDIPKNRSWRPFQIAFFLVNLPSLSDVHHTDRQDSPEALADLLFFPTGGGKTEAYLGLTAFALGIRRLQGVVNGKDGSAGVAVIMRYTLRLLTLQQFQRATALICACESIRREAIENGDTRWGTEPFRLGLWVGGKTTPNSTDESAESIAQLRSKGIGGSSPAQISNCPWCGSSIDPKRQIDVDKQRKRTIIYCGDSMGKCLYSRKRSGGEGLPAVVVDEEIYRQLPALIISTVDKWAQMPWNGRTQMLFGRVNGYCPRHGYRSPEVDDADSHMQTSGLPAVRTEPRNALRPPDLIIQDELHLISGPLGSLVGLYETAVNELCAWEVDGQRVHPKVIASTATIRNARRQMHSLFLRKVEIFPPQGSDVRDNFFSIQKESSEEVPGRLYFGICAPGKRLKSTLIRVYIAQLGAAQALYNKYGKAADPWMTLVGYFSSMRELGGMRRLVDDDVTSRLKKIDRRGLAARSLREPHELTSRLSAAQIPEILDRLEIPFDPTSQARREAAQKAKAHSYLKDHPSPYDVLLATNMISVGVDVQRLGLMVVSGQPKSSSEYIQATSRVGRATPGVVCTVYNWVRPRDLSHYEQFEHYHATFYKQVESLSVTPFAARALDRGLSGILVAMLRLYCEELNANETAQNMTPDMPVVKHTIQRIVQRSAGVTESKEVADKVQDALNRRRDRWYSNAMHKGTGASLGYRGENALRPLLQKPVDNEWDLFTCLNSLRDVESSANLLLIEDKSGSDK